MFNPCRLLPLYTNTSLTAFWPAPGIDGFDLPVHPIELLQNGLDALSAPFASGPLPSGSLTPTLVIASGNPHKVEELHAMLDIRGLEVRQKPSHLEIEETGSSYLENARLKAEAVASYTGQWALADDSGLEVDALDGGPGLYSARYAPTDHERIHRLLHAMGDSLYRGASFRSAMALADPGGTTVLEAEGECRGLILREPDGHGTGYDSIFYVREAGCSYARMGSHLKSKLGSRGKAARQLAPGLKRLLGIL